HLRQRPERDALAVRRRPALVPPHLLGDAVAVLVELPGEPALADAGVAGDRDETRPAVARDRVVRVAQDPELRVPTDERRLERIGPPGSTDPADHPNRPERRHRTGLALERGLACRLEGDRLLG